MHKTHLPANIKHADNLPQVVVMSVSICTLNFIGGKFLLEEGIIPPAAKAADLGKVKDLTIEHLNK